MAENIPWHFGVCLANNIRSRWFWSGFISDLIWFCSGFPNLHALSANEPQIKNSSVERVDLVFARRARYSWEYIFCLFLFCGWVFSRLFSAVWWLQVLVQVFFLFSNNMYFLDKSCLHFLQHPADLWGEPAGHPHLCDFICWCFSMFNVYLIWLCSNRAWLINGHQPLGLSMQIHTQTASWNLTVESIDNRYLRLHYPN